MNFAEANRSFHELQQRYQRGSLPYEHFLAEVDQLRVVWADGSTWKPDPLTNGWLVWNGQAWQPAQPPVPVAASPSTPASPGSAPATVPGPAAPTSPAPVAPSPPPREPETLAELGAMILRMVARGFVWKLALGAGIFLAVWIFHTFVLVYINEGFWASSSGSFWSSWLGRLGIRGFLQAPLVKALVSTTDAILATRGQRTLPIVLIWMLAPSLITGALVRMKVMGFRTWLSNVLTTPAWVSKTLRSAEPSPLTLPLFLFSAAIGLGAAVAFGAPAFLGNRPLVFVAALHGLSALAARLATFTVLVTRVTWNDIQRVALPRRPRRPLNPLHLLLVHLGLTAGLTAGALLPWLTVLGTLGIFVAVAAGTAVLVISLTRGRGPGRPGGPLVLLLLVMVLTAAVAIPVWADDGGWQEAGGTFTSWVKSQGAGPAVVAGVIPSLAAAAGALLGALASAVASAVAGIGAGAASAAAGAVAGAAATGAGGAASSTAGGGSPPAAGAGTAAAGPPGAAPPVTGTPAQPPPGATMPPTEKMPVVPPVPPPEPTPPEPPGKAKAEPKQPPQKKEPEPQKKTKEKPQPEPTQHQDDKEKPEPEKAKEEKPQPEPKKHEQKPPVKPKKKEGYLAGLWRRAKGAAKSVAGAVSATAQAAKDIYNDPSLITETAKNIGHEVKETAKAAADVGKKAFGAVKHMVTHPKETLKKIGGAIKSGAKEVAQAAKDVYNDPSILTETLKGSARTVHHIGTAVKDTLTDPDKTVDFIETITGINDIKKSIESDRSLGSRLAHAALGWTQLLGVTQGVSSATRGAGAAEEAASLAAKAAEGGADDVVRIGARAAEGGADDVVRIGAKAAEGGADDAIRTVGAADDAAAATAKDAATLKNEAAGTSKARPDDFIHDPAVAPDTSGYTRRTQKAVQKVANEEGVQVYSRPSTSHAAKLLENGEALPKPMYIKNKTANELDTMLGLSDDALGKAAHFDPKLPPDEVLDHLPPETRTKLIERFNMRKEEFVEQSDHIMEQGGAIHIKKGVIHDNLTGKPFTGDVDIYAIRDMHGNPLPPEKVERVIRKLRAAGADVRHGAHEMWNKAGLTPEEREIADKIDQAVRNKHTREGGEALVIFRPGKKNPGAAWLAEHAAKVGGAP